MNSIRYEDIINIFCWTSYSVESDKWLFTDNNTRINTGASLCGFVQFIVYKRDTWAWN